MSARRFAIVTESCWPVGRSATRSRIGSGRVSWRRRLCARLGEMPRSAQTASDAVVVWQAGAGVPAVGELLLLVDEAELLALVGLGLDASDLVGRGLVVEQQDDQACAPARGLRTRRFRRARGWPWRRAAAAVRRRGERSAGRGRGGGRCTGSAVRCASAVAASELDAVVGDVLAGVGGEFEFLERDALDACPRRVPGRRW